VRVPRVDPLAREFVGGGVGHGVSVERQKPGAKAKREGKRLGFYDPERDILSEVAF
jgi:hypothetical protein